MEGWWKQPKVPIHLLERTKGVVMMYRTVYPPASLSAMNGKRPVLTPAGSSGRARSPEGMRTVRDRCNSGSHGMGDDPSCGWGDGGFSFFCASCWNQSP